MTRKADLVSGLLLMASVGLAAQTPPPVNGVTGTVALEGTTNTVYRALNVAIVETVEGVEHVVHFTKHIFVHGGGKGTSVDR